MEFYTGDFPKPFHKKNIFSPPFDKVHSKTTQRDRFMNNIAYLLKRLLPFLAYFLFLQMIVRVALSAYSYNDVGEEELGLVLAFLIGVGFDIAVFFYLAIPVMAAFIFIPVRWRGHKKERLAGSAIFFIYAYVLMFCAASEWFFWDEFQDRFNFIAVDYLVYTHEVIGNIRESYPVELLMTIMALVVTGLTGLYYKKVFTPDDERAGWRTRAAGFLIIIGISIVSFITVDTKYADITKNRYVNEIARNGIYELFSAFRKNDLNYEHFYATQPKEQVEAFMRKTTGANKDAISPLLRTIDNRNAPRQYNLVMVTVESLSANYLTEFGEKRNITPNLDKLTGQSLFFDNLYATGTRTVYGLASLTLGMPPVAGNSIVRKEDNGGLFTIGGVLKDKGYETKFIYGGFGYFDNMNAFFEANGYEIVDRNMMADDEIHFANIWGVADDDLFRKVIKEADESYENKKPFFSMVMTTSNHRPYTYPEGRIDIPSKSGRTGGVKYTDYSIDYFLSEAKKKPWFKDTIFVIVADHTSGSSGKGELEPNKYHIPMWIYAPDIIKPGRVSHTASQIDVPPTVLGLMGVDYESRFFGVDLMKEKPGRIFISNYQQLGYLTDKGLVILSPQQKVRFYNKDENGVYTPHKGREMPQEMLDAAIGYYQGAEQWRTWSAVQ